MAESKVQRVARTGKIRDLSAGECCGQPRVWARLMIGHGRMIKLCEKCGRQEDKCE